MPDEEASKFVLGVDLDGVCADFIGGFRRIAAEWLGVNESELTSAPSYDYPEWKMDSAGGWLDAYHYAITRREIFRTLSPIPGASVSLRRLWTAERVRIRIITHRLFFEFFHAEAIKQTIEWLDRHAFPYWDICFMRDKAAVGADLYIEDSPTNVEALRAAGKRVICYGNSTNEHIPAPRAKDWREIETMVLQEFKDWEKGPQPTLPGS